MYLSYWEKDLFLSDVDVTVIGNGIVGLNAAITLKKKHPRLKVVLFDRGVFEFGASTRNAGFACIGSITELVEDMKTAGEEETWKLVEKRWRGLQELLQNVEPHAMDFEWCGSYELFGEKDEEAFELSVQKKADFNLNIKRITGIENNFSVADDAVSRFGFAHVDHLVYSKAEGFLHPGKMIWNLMQKAIALGIYFYSVEVKEIFPATDRVKLLADEFEFFARKVLVTTNGYASKLLPAVDVVPARAQVLVTSAVEGLKLHGTFHFDKGFYYFRNIGDKILLGGARNSDFTGETTVELKLTDGIQQKLEYMLREVILPGQEFTIEQQWSGIMGMGAEKKPVVKKVDKNLFCAVRMSGMGVAIGSLVGKEAAEMMSEELI